MIGDHNLGICEWPHLVNSTAATDEQCLHPSSPEDSALELHRVDKRAGGVRLCVMPSVWGWVVFVQHPHCDPEEYLGLLPQSS